MPATRLSPRRSKKSALAAPASPRVEVGSLSRKEFRALPRKVRLDYDLTDLDLAVGKNRAASYALRLGIVGLVINPFFHAFGYKAGIIAALTAGAVMTRRRAVQ